MADVRALKRRLEVLKTQPPKILKSGPEGDKLLQQATAQYKERNQDSARKNYDLCYEAAGDLINLGKGRILSYGGIGRGYRLGSGKWKFINGKWVKGG